MCGRVFVRTSLDGILRAFAFAARSEAVEGLANEFPRWNGAPGRDYPIIVMDVVREPNVRGPIFVRANWGFVPNHIRDFKGRQINARSETVATNGIFTHAYRARRALMPIDGFFEWQDIFGSGKNKQPYAISMKDDAPFALAAIWESWRDPATGLEQRTFAILTCEPNALMAKIHDRMPVILHEKDFARWLSDEPNPRELLKPYPAELMKMWPIGSKVGNRDNDSPDILDEVEPDREPPPPSARSKKPPKGDPPAQGSLF